MAALAVETRDGLAEIGRRVDGLRDEQAGDRRRTELRLAGIEAAIRSGAPAQTAGLVQGTDLAQATPNIDRMLTESGWVVQDAKATNLYAGLGVAVREFVLSPGMAAPTICSTSTTAPPASWRPSPQDTRSPA